MPRVFRFVLVILVGAVSVNAAAQQLPDLRSVKAARRSDTRLDDQLVQLVERAETMPAAQAARSMPTAVRDAVPVSIRFDAGGASIESSLSQLGIATANKADGVIEAYVPIDLLTHVAALTPVKKVNAIVRPVAKVTSQGVVSHLANTWQAGGQTGAGVKVGIIDIGFQGLLSLLGTELPASVTARCYNGIGSFTSSLSVCENPPAVDTLTAVHGTAVAETITDVAPGVQLYIANPMSPLDLRNTVEWMTSQGVQIINHSVAWTWDGPGDGTSPFSDAPLLSVDLAVSGGAMWVNAAGNEAEATWTGAFTDSNGDDLLEFDSSPQCATVASCEINRVALQIGEEFVAQLRWEDSWTAAKRDLNLYLLQSTASPNVFNVVAASLSVQSGSDGDVPFERLNYTPSSFCTCNYYLAVRHLSGPLPGWVQLQTFTSETLQFHTAGRSIANPAESANPGLLAAGAAPWFNPNTIEWFSSLGPTTDGRTKPDVVGADQGTTVTYGSRGFVFAGTSQASPHIAGLAALVLGAFPNTPPAQLAAYLRATASPNAPQNTWGAGFAQVPAFPSTISVSAFLSDKTFPVPANQPITWRAFAIGGNGPFEYQFWVYDGVNWTLGQGYCPSNTFTWTPPGAGTYLLQVWARHIGSSEPFEDWKSSGFFSVTGQPAVAVTSLTSNGAFPVSFGTPITWTATATGGSAPLQYQFWRLRQGVGWTMVQDYSPNNTFMWTPSVTEGGTYSLQVWVRSAGSSQVFDAWRGTDNFVINGPPAVTVTSFTSNVSFPAPAFSPIQWTATATGGVGPLLYQFWRLRQGVGWTMVQDYSALNTFSWTPVEAEAGSYVLQVWVKSSLSSALLDAWSSTGNFEISPAGAVQITSLASSVMLPTTVGTPITLSATATGGSPPVQFKFWLRDGSGAWVVLKDYSPVANVSWTPTQSGNYVVQVWARSTGSLAAFEDWRGTPTFMINPSAVPVVSSLNANVSLPAIVTNSMTWTAIAAGGTAPLLYEFWRYRQGSGWTRTQDYSASPTYTWTPGMGEEGTYQIQVWVRSAGSTAAFETWRGTDDFRVIPSTVLRLVGQPGNYVGGSTETILTNSDATFAPTRNFDNGVSISATNFTGGQSIFWYLDFAAAGNAALVPGIYEAATRFPFQASTEPGLSISGNGAGCNMLWGRFVVLEVAFGGGGVVDRFAADFEQHCEGFAAALFGSIRYNSTIPLVPIHGVAVAGILPGHVGVPLAWTAPGAAGREYQFWRYSQTTHQWLLLQSYSSNPTVIWTPAAGDEGSWAIEVWERPAGSGTAYEQWRSSGGFSISL
jgi:hypothetical protein